MNGAAQLLSHEQGTACQRVWGAVLLTLINDAFAVLPRRNEAAPKLNKQRAQDYLTADHFDYFEVCGLAGVEPYALRRWCQQMHQQGWPPELNPCHSLSMKRKPRGELHEAA